MQLSSSELWALQRTFKIDEEGWVVRIKKTTGKSKLGRPTSFVFGYPTWCWLGKRRVAHHIAWALIHGEWPDKGMDIDHIDRQRWNCKPDNLRRVTRSANMHNTVAHTDARSKVKGVDFCHKRSGNKWRARICIDGKAKQLGYFPTESAAGLALDDYRKELGWT